MEPRLYISDALEEGGAIVLDKEQSHYLGRVMRLGNGDTVKLFNGRDGEWRGEIAGGGKNALALNLTACLRAQQAEPDLWLLFAPIKGKRIDTIAEKAGELGVSELWPVNTARTVVSRVNVDRLQANAIEAAEQCERLTLPEVHEVRKLSDMLATWPDDRRLMYCDERAGAQTVPAALAAESPGPWAVLVGPEGGFAPDEQNLIRNMPQSVPVSLGPRLLRTDTACFAALSLWQAHMGDWTGGDAGWLKTDL